MFTDLEFIKTALNAITLKFRSIQSNVDAVQSNVDAVQSNVDAVQSNVDAVQSNVDAVQSNVDTVKQSVPDWDEPNSASHAYIKNKPCYDYIESSGVIWESDSADTSGMGVLIVVDLVDGWLIEGETYRLTVDGVTTTYTCAADADGRGMYIGAGYLNGSGSISQSNTDARLQAWTTGLWVYGQKVRLEGSLRRYKKLDTTLYDAVVSVNGETGEVQITPENIEAANAGSLVVSNTILSSVIYGTRKGETCNTLYLGGNRFLQHSSVADTGEECFFLGPEATILAGIKTPTINDQAANKGYVDATVAAPRDSIRLYSSTEGSTKQFEITVNDDGVISAVEVAE